MVLKGQAVPLTVLDCEFDADREALERLLGELRLSAGADAQTAKVVTEIIDQVRGEGDEALVKLMRTFTKPDATLDDIRVGPSQLAAACDGLDRELRQAMERSIDNVRAYQRYIMPIDPPRAKIAGAELGLRFVPMRRVGLTVPGGRAAYPSTVIMLAVPAQVAGVEELAVCCPPPTLGRPSTTLRAGGGPSTSLRTGGNLTDVSPLVLGLCHILGIDEVYRLGGAEAVAAMAMGTQTVRPVDFIAGPGNVYSQQAKRQVFGVVGIDGFYGPSEVALLADETADPEAVASELLAQAEHDPGRCFLIAVDRKVIDAILGEMRKQLLQCKRRQAIERALREGSAAVLVPSVDAALELIDRIAAEHVVLAVAEPHVALEQLHHGGAWFLGDQSPVASGDYYAGPSHCLPTGTTARFTSGLSVYTFLKRSSIETYPDGMPQQAIDDIARLAEAEGLDAHAAAVRRRRP